MNQAWPCGFPIVEAACAISKIKNISFRAWSYFVKYDSKKWGIKMKIGEARQIYSAQLRGETAPS